MVSSYKPSDALPADPTGYVDVRCTCTALECVVLAYSTAIQAGPVGTVSDRKMKNDNSADTLSYGLYKDITRLLPWGVGANASGGVVLLAQFGDTLRTTVYGRIPAGQVVPTGHYGDSPLVVVTY